MTRRSRARDQRVQHSELELELARHVGTNQLELVLEHSPPASSRSSSFSPQPLCSECGRRGYHLARCTNGGAMP